MEKNLCLLIDFENIAAGTEKDGLGRFDVNLVLERLADKGRVLIARSYADWGRFARFKQGLLAANVSMMELTSHGMQDKNRADIALVVEGMELAFTKPYIDTFVVVSGDSDFTPMVLKMRELDKRVIGCGCRSSTSRLLIQACDEFIFYDNLAKRKKSRTAKKETRRSSSSGEPSLDDAFELLVDTLEGLQRENPDPPHASVVKSAMLRKSPDFNESDLGFSSLARFLERARKAGKVTLIRDEKSGGYRVDQPTSGQDEGDHHGGGSAGSGGSGGSKRSDLWLDPYLPEGAARYVEVLSAEGLNPLAAPTRKAVLQCLEEVVDQREKRKRRNTVHFVQDDVTKRLRKTHPDLPAKGIRNVFNGLMRANAFMHRDGNPVRTGSAPFALQKTAEELNETLTDIYIYELIGNGMQLDVPVLAELFLGDRSRTRPIEESLAYHQAHAQEDDDEPTEAPDLDEVDMESLLLDDDDALLEEDDDDADEPPAKKAAAKPAAKAKESTKDKAADEPKAEAKKPTRKRSTRKKSTAKKDEAAKEASDKDEPKALEAEKTDAEPAKEEAPKEETKKKSTRKRSTAKKTTKKADPEPSETDDGDSSDDDAEPEATDDKPKKTTRRRTRKKRTEPAKESSSDDLDSLLSED